MELTTSMLADAAQRTPDGKLHILGGQWDRLVAATFPTTHPSLALALVFRVEYNEALKRHSLHIELVKDGQPAGVGVTGHLEVGHPAGMAPGASQAAALAITFPMVTFQTPGRYEWVIRVGEEIMGSIPLEVMEAPTPSG